MITTALFKKMADDLAEVGSEWFYEHMGLSPNDEITEGVWIVTRGGSISNSKGLSLSETIDIYVAFNDKVRTEAEHMRINRWLIENKGICELSGVFTDAQGVDYPYAFENIRIVPTSTPSNNGLTTTGLVVKVASANVIYDLVNN